jgi:hypothetical protein
MLENNGANAPLTYPELSMLIYFSPSIYSVIIVESDRPVSLESVKCARKPRALGHDSNLP